MANFVKVANKNDFPLGTAKTVAVNNKVIAVFNIGGKYYAISDECTHAAGPLSEGEISGTTVTCPLHGASFDVTTGAVLGEPANEGVESFRVHVEGDEIRVEV